MENTKVGIGFDMHPLVKGRPLVLGGIKIPFGLGLDGHSDGDALIHSICDALLGSCAKRDIGYHFPGIKKYKDISSLLILKKVRQMMKEYKINNIDVTVVAQKPKLSSFINKMRKKVAETLGITISCVSIKSTTAKKLGVIGNSEAIASMAAVSVMKY